MSRECCFHTYVSDASCEVATPFNWLDAGSDCASLKCICVVLAMGSSQLTDYRIISMYLLQYLLLQYDQCMTIHAA